MAEKDQSYTILVADDEREVVDLVRLVLEIDGHTVLSAEDGEQALARTGVILPDLILMDVRMPKMSGLTVLKHLHEDPLTADIPVIMLSVVTTHPEVQTALHNGAVAYLSKPFEIRELSRLVGRVLKMDATERELLRKQAINSIGR
jgi:CheY-like chemotaxis protein